MLIPLVLVRLWASPCFGGSDVAEQGREVQCRAVYGSQRSSIHRSQ